MSQCDRLKEHVMEIRQVLTMSAEERASAKLKNPEIAKRAGLLFNGGKIYGQCKHYSPLGDNPYLNGTCSKVVKRDYTRPGDVACNKMERA